MSGVLAKVEGKGLRTVCAAGIDREPKGNEQLVLVDSIRGIVKSTLDKSQVQPDASDYFECGDCHDPCDTEELRHPVSVDLPGLSQDRIDRVQKERLRMLAKNR